MRLMTLFPALLLFLACSTPRPQSLEDGLAAYRQNDIEEALPQFERAAAEQPGNAQIHAWVAETRRRSGNFNGAMDAARTALELDGCNSFAHTVIAAVYNPAYQGLSDADSSWTHALTAIECDPSDGNARIGVWGESMRRGERETEDQALQALIDHRFLTTTVLAFNRWVLRGLPDSAIVVTAGDWDTFPALALQVSEGLRTDVAVVNINMLNLPWYRDLIAERHGISLPDIERPTNTRPQAGLVVTWWRDQRVGDTSERPLAFAVTIPEANVPVGAGHLQDAGAFRRVVPITAAPYDTATMRLILEDLSAAEFTGPTTSVRDRSAVRLAAENSFPALIMFAGARYARVLRETERVDEAREVVEWVTQFGTDVGASEQTMDWFREVLGEM